MNSNFDYESWIIMAVGLTIFFSGIRLYLNLVKRSNPKFFYSNVGISWVLISMFPVILLFSVFKDNNLTGQITNTTFGTITVGGAFGAFFVLWLMGTRYSFEAMKEDHNVEKIKLLNEQVSNLQDQFKALGATPKDTRIIPECRRIEYEFTSGKKRTFGLITGDLGQVHGIDLWVNSENIDLQMARFYDPSISGLIRYMGAKKDREGNVIEDTVANALMDCVMGDQTNSTNKHHSPVKPGLAFTTTSGTLRETNGVQGIVHVATVVGEVSRGYRSVENLAICVQSALHQADMFALNEKKKRVSIIFPLFGTGTAKGDLEIGAKNLFHSALAYFESKLDSKVDRVYFLVWKRYEKEACVTILEDMDILTRKQPA